MSDTLITVVAIVLVAGLLFVVPLITMADNFDSTSQTQVEAIVSDFVGEIKTTRKITQEKYDKFLQNLEATGYTFETEMQVEVLDDNPGKKTSQTARDKIGENVYYTEYTSQIEQKLETEGVYNLKEGDTVTVKVRNTDLTLAQQMKNFMYKVVGNDKYTIVADQSGLVQ